ncbi:MAG: transcriptional regulator [Segetibacter sp.]|nr:transcriptional regulator [Segetibacter sp.]
MRQLDLFGSLFDTPPQENKPGGKPVVSKKEEQSSIVAASGSPYSKNALRSERAVADHVTIKDKTPEVAIENLEEEATRNYASSTPSPLLLSLFDDLIVPKGIESGEQEVEAIIHENQAETPPPEDRREQIITTEPDAPQIADEPKVLVVEEQLNTSSASSTSEPAAEAKKKITVPKQKQKVPELERNGSVIFDDGKISVKIKNSSPFPAPIVKEKKPKVKKPPQKRGRKSFKEIDAEVDLIEIPEDEILFQKQYYPISEVARWFRVNTSLLRFWENEFDVLKPRKNRKGDRLFRPEDVKNLQLIYQLLRQRKYTIEGAKEYIKTNKKKADIQLQLTNTLQKFKSFLLDMKANLQS